MVDVSDLFGQKWFKVWKDFQNNERTGNIPKRAKKPEKNN